MSMTTPRIVSDDIRAFCQSLVAGSTALFVDFVQVDGAVPDECFDNVDLLVTNQGGRPLLGWTIWEWEGALLEAEFHAVWEDDDGNLVDPTPKADGEQRILFLPDRSASDHGGVTPSRHYPLQEWDEVTEYIAACNDISGVQMRFYPNIPADEWIPVIQRRERCADALNRRTSEEATRQASQQELMTGVALSEDDAQRRSESNPVDIEARTAHARYLASNGDFNAAFQVLLESARQSQQVANDLGDTFRLLFTICDDPTLVNETRREWSRWLY
ncbi:hypothetical protein DTL42_14135 [Bremerella cremea]|uniref:Uncharacterized protein n=1 Tax=Bremerella cremea TaxID=1031537 RepID=A0A368KPY7_9BACT|nr:tetratricopeptide repeat protein [Bremerella cremea]RCS47656.1 hypothetical protein DTL42_14135 [Bremerella cremea]